jgi:hypothetical protein
MKHGPALCDHVLTGEQVRIIRTRIIDVKANEHEQFRQDKDDAGLMPADPYRLHIHPFRRAGLQQGQQRFLILILRVHPDHMLIRRHDDRHPVMNRLYEFVGLCGDDGTGVDWLSVR